RRLLHAGRRRRQLQGRHRLLGLCRQDRQPDALLRRQLQPPRLLGQLGQGQDPLRVPLPRLPPLERGPGDPRAGRVPALPSQGCSPARRNPPRRRLRPHPRSVLGMAIPTPRDVQLAVVDWLDSRFPFTEVVDESLTQRVPNYANAFYYCFGGMVFILIVLQIVTGIFLAFYYVPDGAGNPAPAYTSVNFIMNH